MKAKVSIPVSVKLSPFFTAAGNFVTQIESIGADGVVLFNRFFRPDFDLETLSVKREVALVDPCRYLLAAHLDRVAVAAPKVVSCRWHGR